MFLGKLILASLSWAYVFCGGIDVKLSRRSTIYLPYSYNPDGSENFGLDKGSAEQMTFDSDNKIAYIVGAGVLHVLDVSNPDQMEILLYRSFPGAEFTDVEHCGGFVFVAVDNATVRTEGEVYVFSKFESTSNTMPLVFRFAVGFVPDMVKPTKDCSKLVVAVEAEAFDNDAGGITDPPGQVVIVTFDNGEVSNNFDMKTLDFQDFDDKVSSLRSSGVRHVYQENNNPFSNDVEPEYITFNDDDTIAYVALQENNAVAVVNIEEGTITDILGLGFKDWGKSTLDASDKDTGALPYPYPVLGMFQPDTIKHFRFRGDNYILLANEGDSKDYSAWSEEKRAKDIDPAILPTLDETTRDQIGRDTLLGRLKLSVSPAGMNSTGHLEALYTFGGRGFSIRRADDMSLVYDSADDVSLRTLLLRTELFNCHLAEESNRVFEDRDARSDDKGAETESLAVGEAEGRTLLFIGNERPGTIFVYSLHKDVSKPEFHDIYDGIPEKRGKSWRELFDARELSDVDAEDIHFVPADKSPTGKPILFSTGTVSGSVSIINVEVTRKADPPGNTAFKCIGTSCTLFLTLVISLLFVRCP